MNNYQSKLIFDLVSHTMFNNVGYDKLNEDQKKQVRLEILRRKLIQNKL